MSLRGLPLCPQSTTFRLAQRSERRSVGLGPGTDERLHAPDGELASIDGVETLGLAAVEHEHDRPRRLAGNGQIDQRLGHHIVIHAHIVIHGARLQDPHKLLQGSGKQTRFLRLPSPAVLVRPEVEELIAAAIAQSKAPLPPKGRGTLIIRSVSAKQRSRR